MGTCCGEHYQGSNAMAWGYDGHSRCANDRQRVRCLPWQRANKLSRGTFTAGFFMRALGALGCSPGDMGHLIDFSAGNLMTGPKDFPARLGKADEEVSKPSTAA